MNTLDLSLISVWSGHVTTRPNFKLVLFLLFTALIFLVKGQVSSTRYTVGGVVVLMIITMSGLGWVTIIFEGTVLPLIFAQLSGLAGALVDALMAKLITLKFEENKVPLVFSIRAELSVLLLKQLNLLTIQYHLWASFICHEIYEAVIYMVMVTNGISF